MIHTAEEKTITMPNNSALALYYNEIFIGTFYFKKGEEITINKFANNYYVLRGFAMIYFTSYQIKEEYIK